MTYQINLSKQHILDQDEKGEEKIQNTQKEKNHSLISAILLEWEYDQLQVLLLVLIFLNY